MAHLLVRFRLSVVPVMFARVNYTKGFTLIELVISIVVVGAGVTAIFSLTTQAASYGTDPMTYKQSMAIAESYMEEIRGKRFSTGSCPSVPTSNVRANYSYICHYDTSGSDVAIADQQGKIWKTLLTRKKRLMRPSMTRTQRKNEQRRLSSPHRRGA